MAEIIKIVDGQMRREDLALALKVLKNNGIIVYPTETFYGLGGLASSEIALSKIYTIKGRNPSQPLPFIASDLEMVMQFVTGIPDVALVLAERFWPGPLTLVLKAEAEKLPAAALGPGETVAVRVPPLVWLRQLVREAGTLLVSTSANLTGKPPLSNFEQVCELFAERVDILINGGSTPGGQPSTILDLTVSPPKCLREGVIPLNKIFEILERY